MTNETKQKTLEKETIKNLKTLVANIKDMPLEGHPIADLKEKFKKRSGIISVRMEDCEKCGGCHIKAYPLSDSWYISGSGTLRKTIEELNERMKSKLPGIEYYVGSNNVASTYKRIDVDTIHVSSYIIDDLDTIANYNVEKKNLLRSSADRLKSDLEKCLGASHLRYFESHAREMLEKNKAKTVNTLKECVEILKLKTK